MITSERTRNQRGLGAVSLALTLPIVLLIVIGSIELFLYMRAVSLVTRAAGEAAQVMASASPSANYTANSFTGVGDKEEIKTPSGGVIGKDLDASVASHGKFYGPLPEATALPFELARSLNPDNSGSAEAGVMYLPLATAYTCLKPLNEEDDYSNSNCGDGTNLQSRLGFLTYQQPTKADFDGDGKEDLAYFSPNPTGPDWWIIPSSSGILFRNALTFELGPDSGAGVEGVEMVAPQAEHWMPCVADYDNDGKSDVCVASSNGSEITIKIRFSSNLFYLNSAFTVSAHGAAKILPVPGRWHSATVDQFAVILVEAGTRKYQLSTLVWPAFEAKLESPALNSDAFSLVDGPKEYTDDSYKPTASKNWRPTFGDHNGDGLLDISWAEWPGGYLTNLIAGKALGMELSLIHI